MKKKNINNIFYKNFIEINSNNKDYIEIYSFINEKILYIQNIIRNTILSIQSYKLLNIFSNSDIEICNTTLIELYSNTISLIEFNNSNFESKSKNIDSIMIKFQELIDKLLIIISGFGTKNIHDILFINFGYDFDNFKFNDKIIESKYNLIKNHLHPIGFKIMHVNPTKKSNNNNIQTIVSHSSTPLRLQTKNNYCENKLCDEKKINQYSNFECYEIENNEKSFYYKINGIQVVIKDEKLHKAIIINCISDELLLNYFSNQYIDYRKKNIIENIPKSDSYELDILKRLIDASTIKDILIYGNEDIYKKYKTIITDVQLIKSNKIDVTIKNFIELDLFMQRNLLINLLIYNNEPNIHYIAYLLYDLLTVQNDNNESFQQKVLYDSFPCKIKSFLKDTMNITMKYTCEMNSKYDINKISLEQQVFLFKAPDAVKEKAINKMKEIKSKTDETSIKSKQYLEGLLRIPFENYKIEPILKINKINNQKFIALMNNNKELFNWKRSEVADVTETIHSGNEVGRVSLDVIKKDYYTKVEINQTIKKIEIIIFNYFFKDIKSLLIQCNNKIIINIIHFFHNLDKNIIKQLPTLIIEQYNNITHELVKSNIKQIRVKLLLSLIELLNNNIVLNIDNMIQLCKIYDLFDNNNNNNNHNYFSKIPIEIKEISLNNKKINQYINNITDILDDSIYGQTHAKNQILKIFSQWMTGEQSGYCFGFEGYPGIGKTSLAKKGLSNCLIDENGQKRPFAFIALGGSCNGSILEGHSYTYVNSSWGRIVDFLMETKCMNPIIYIDELDKVSKTENGREIIGILTHLIDSTQNDVFQDKYFSGIEIDLSKVLFIFSYNDPEQIDKVLLDRIHRIKFENLSLNEKIVIVEKYILPEINKKMGFSNTVILSNHIIEYIIKNYTLEPGVRKLKEVLFDLYGEINIQILTDDNTLNIPIIIKLQDLETKYLKKYIKIEDKKINLINKIGIINGLWANSLGKGGIIQIEAVFFPSTTFLELKLTGLQGDVMKESMNVAKTLAWNLSSEDNQKKLIQYFDSTKCQGIHIHCPEGSVSKDGPSAGAAITVAIYSLLNNKKIKNDIAITGEINLQGDITAIGGLEAKIMGGIQSGIKTFLYPKDNKKDLNDIMNNENNFENICFISVENIKDVFQYIFE